MATHSNMLAWVIPQTEEPGGLQSVGSQKVGRNLVTEHAQLYYTILYKGLEHRWILVSCNQSPMDTEKRLYQ